MYIGVTYLRSLKVVGLLTGSICFEQEDEIQGVDLSQHSEVGYTS